MSKAKNVTNAVRVEAFQEIQAAKIIRTHIASLTDDEDTINDTLEGETDLIGLMTNLCKAMQDADIMIDGIKAREDELATRKERYKARKETLRALIAEAMTVAGRERLELSLATLVMAQSQPAIVVTDESKIPTVFWKPQDPTLDKKALLSEVKKREAEIKAGVEGVTRLEGVELKNGAPVLNIRKA